jgi:hypothetical protein
MNAAPPFSGATAATLVTAILLTSMALGFVLALGGRSWTRLFQRRRNSSELPLWMAVNPTLQQHLRHGEIAASALQHPTQSDSLPLGEQPPQHSDCDDPPAC